jgi:hypothetical protein
VDVTSGSTRLRNQRFAARASARRTIRYTDEPFFLGFGKQAGDRTDLFCTLKPAKLVSRAVLLGENAAAGRNEIEFQGVNGARESSASI